jgi:uncharacterized membrane protein YdjX (TVP38/TMEM64 family)
VTARRWAPVLAAAGVVAALVAARALDAPARLRAALDGLEALGPWGPAAFVALYVVATVLLLPAWILTLGAGALFGLATGVATVSLAATLGATAAFLVGRYLARDAVARWLDADPRFRAIDAAVGREGWRIVGLVRLSPLFPFTLVNYVFGLTRVPLVPYVVASWAGMLPGTVMYVYLGSVAGGLATLGQPGTARTPAEWVFLVLGLLATLAVTSYVTRLARGALDRRVAA